VSAILNWFFLCLATLDSLLFPQLFALDRKYLKPWVSLLGTERWSVFCQNKLPELVILKSTAEYISYFNLDTWQLSTVRSFTNYTFGLVQNGFSVKMHPKMHFYNVSKSMDFHENVQHWPKLGFEVRLLSRRLRLKAKLYILIFAWTTRK